MNKTTFHPEKYKKSEIVPTEFDQWRGRLIQGEVHDESAWAIGKKEGGWFSRFVFNCNGFAEFYRNDT